LLAALLSSGILSGCAGIVNATKTGPTQAIFQVNPLSLNFGKVGVGKQTTQTVSITNTGSTSVTISQATISNPQFNLSGVTFPMAMAAGQTGVVTVGVTPTATGTLSGTLTVQGDGGAAPVVVNLSATAVVAGPQISLSGSSIDFGTLSVGSTGSAILTISNTGNANLTVSVISLSGTEFGVSGITTPTTISAGQSVPVALSFHPTASGAVTGGLTITSNDPTNPTETVTLTGTGSTAAAGQLQVSTAALSFGSVSTGSSATQQITLTNIGTGSLQITSLVVTGTGFTSNGVAIPTTVDPSGRVTLNVVFAPTSTGNVTGSVLIASNGTNSPTSISLTGTGTAAPTGQLQASSTSVSFGNVNTGSNATQQITLTNTGTAAVQISSVVASGSGYTVSGITTPVTLNPSSQAALSVVFAPTSAGSVTGSITITSNATGSPLTIALSGVGVQPGLSISPATYDFGSIVDGQTKSQNFTLTNTGSASLTVSQLSVSGTGYSVSGLTTPTTIAAGQSATFSAVFAPTTAGSLTGSVTVSSNAPNSPATISLTGTGVAASVTLSSSPNNLSFGSVNAGTSTSKSVTLSNGGNVNVTISQISVSAKDITTSGVTTPLTLTPGQSQTLNVTFDPSAAETVSGNITVTSSQGASTVVSVSGTGVQAAISVTPSSASFGSVTVGSANSQTIQLSNTGNGVLTITQASVTGSGFSDSGLSLPLSINPGQSSTFNAQFQPSAAGSASGSITIVSNAVGSPSVVALSGTGVAATETLSFSTSSISFGSVNTGASSTQTETITNTGNANVQISQITVSGAGYSLSGASTPVTLTPAQTLAFSIIFSPTAGGAASGSVVVTSNAAGSPATIVLSGTGVQAASHTVALAWTASTSNVSGYNVYRSTTNGSGYSLVNTGLVAGVSYTDTTVQNGTTYYYVTTAVDSSGNESAYSNQATAVIP
jgi:hypothetical protein